ncbi:hypothetical protein D5400_11715 [Georhizobium profundi]|uniref:Uncharacterized protein n=1 Tax=Georhizobium profundi TaxID=2341112 RepID=A0A3Q8XNT8_9HYPH|nr:hypothetical protein D5400_11715 [Georhizobium profundi]
MPAPPSGFAPPAGGSPPDGAPAGSVEFGAGGSPAPAAGGAPLAAGSAPPAGAAPSPSPGGARNIRSIRFFIGELHVAVAKSDDRQVRSL